MSMNIKNLSGGSRRRSSVAPSRWRFGTRTARNFKDRVIGIGTNPLEDLIDGDQEFEDEPQVQFVDNRITSSKYNVWTFVPKNLFEQFRRIANFYFLLVAIISVVIDSPVSPLPSILALLFVILVTMIKQGYEDFLRHRSDGAINHKLVTKIELPNGVRQIPSEKLKVGDLLCVEDGEDFPCDMLLLSSSNPNGKVTIMTANLDGETNLKTHSATHLTRKLTQPHMLNNLRAQVECENPSADLNRFVGRLKVNCQDEEGGNHVETVSLGLENVAFRGTTLKNTEFAYGCAIYTGPDTKMSQNSRMKANKFSSIEVSMNKYLVFFLLVLLTEIVLSTILEYTIGIDRPNLSDDSKVPWYLSDHRQGRIPLKCTAELNLKNILQDSLSFLVLYNYIIPISLYVTLEFQKFVGSLFLAWDLNLYDEGSDQPAKCNTSDLNEELGQIEYLFSDKTGTLTENVMLFKQCSIDGQLFKDELGKLVLTSTNSHQSHHERSVRRFLEILALCHTVQVAPKKKKNPPQESIHDQDLAYNASSPDEKAIVEACKNYGVVFLGEREEEAGNVYCKLLQEGKTTSFHKIHVLEFDSDRKRMSVIIKDPKGNIRLVTKGAEVTVLPKCTLETTSSKLMEQTVNHINQFANEGLRTLAVAVKALTDDELEDFMKAFTLASQSLENREGKIKALYEAMENGLELVGAIGVEDRLQDGVRDTLISLGKAGIKVWILTGDKKETAINISRSCGHFRPNMTSIDITGLENPDNIEHVLNRHIKDLCNLKQICLIVDGKTLAVIFSPLNKKEVVPLLRKLAQECASVICCRMSPLQKAEIVAMMKDLESKPVTAAVGDGANDVAMIQEAHVGLGIMGKEGRAAVRSADFAFAKFKHLQRILLVHGHWFYVRTATLVQYFFYKNITAFTAQLIFACFNSFSTQPVYDSINLTLYNICFTSAPIFAFGLFEQNLSAERLLKEPREYKSIAKNRLLAVDKCLLWIAEGLFHCILAFFAFYFLWQDKAAQPANSLEMLSFGIAVYTAVVILVNLRLLIHAKNWNVVLVVVILLTVVFYFGFTLIVHGLRVSPSIVSLFFENVPEEGGKIPLFFDMYWVAFHVFASGEIWLTILLILAMSILPFIFAESLKHHFPSMKDLVDAIKGKDVYKVERINERIVSYINQAFQA